VRRHHTGSGRPTTNVIPTDWTNIPAGVIAQTHLAMVTISNPENATEIFNDVTGTTDVIPGATLYSGPASVEAFGGDNVVDAAGELASTRIYQVVLPVTVVGIKPHHVVRVVSSPDPDLVGRDLAINTAQLGDRRFSRVLLTTLND
jgi:hypothetical protein